ncbi:TIGR03986 family CRISPR-associated RAMP protein [Microbispora sp. H10670]|uniref:TIGR03986 family type III CRISPR-associated RAMP protein n=1 Tax=Microbispora sp. H10670 TaxID=2729108 RepID=UPI0016039A86|nr:TIGR03986 family CRISPR-associated RAMP protein [Microbispora sp. H10670]
MADEFLNPYTFVPAYDRDGLPERLADGPPPSRERLREECWTGRIGVRLTVETPLLLLATSRSRPPSEGAQDHRVYPVLLRDGRPHLPSTSVKGMLRAAYETITNSRFGVFGDHTTPLAFRRDAVYAVGMKGVLVGSAGKLFEFEQALLRMYDAKTGALVYPDENGTKPPHHLEKLRAAVKRDKMGHVVTRFVRANEAVKLRLERGEREVVGLAYITGPNIEGKKYERLFFVDAGKQPREILLKNADELTGRWDALMRNYIGAHQKKELFGRRWPDGTPAGPGERVGDGPGQVAWSPHLHQESRREIRGGVLCYAKVEDDVVTALYPVLVPRDLYAAAPAELLPESLHPAPCYERLSPADRVFGWVAPEGCGVKPSAYRGRLRIGPVVCEQDAAEAVERFDGDGMPLSILSSPKPQQGRFYVAESADRPDSPVPDGVAKEDLYRPGRGLRGRKAYWHHAGLDRTMHWSEGQGKRDPAQVRVGGHYREYRRPWEPADDKGTPAPDRKRYLTEHGKEQRDGQNRSIKGWVRPTTVFRFTIDVRDLDEVELGALVWLLTLPPGHFHRLGFGRPLGFGSVRLDVDAEATALHTGKQYAAFYRSLSAVLPEGDPMAVLAGAKAAFERLTEGLSQMRSIREALLAVMRGSPGSPVHYPRVRPQWLPREFPTPPDPRGQNYEWFTENERLDGKKIASGRGRSLPSPTTGTPLIVYRVKEADGSKPGKSGKR